MLSIGEILNIKPVPTFKSREKTGRYEYFQKYYGIKDIADRQIVTGIMIGDNPDTLKCLESVVNNGVKKLRTTALYPLNNVIGNLGINGGWIFIMRAGEVFDEIFPIAFKHYITTTDCDCWNVFIKMYKNYKKQTRLFRHYARFDNGEIKNVLWINDAMHGCLKRVKVGNSS